MLLILTDGHGNYIGEDGTVVTDRNLAKLYDTAGADGMHVPAGFEAVSLHASDFVSETQ